MSYWEKMKDWVIDTAQRVVKTAAETAIGVIGASVLIQDVNWAVLGSTVGLSVIVTILMNLASMPKKDVE